MKNYLFQILQVAIGKQQNLPRILSDDEWSELHSECVRQNVLGIAFTGILKLPDGQLPPSALYAKWKREAEVTKHRYELLKKRYGEVCEIYEKHGVRCCVLMPSPAQVRGERLEVSDQTEEIRGEGLEVSNQTEEVRNEGLKVIGGDPKDIDILCWTDKDKEGKRMVVEYVNFQYISSTHHIKPKVVHQHVDWKTGSFPVDVRFKFSYFNSPLHDRRFLAWVEKSILSVSPQKGKDGFPVPSCVFNAVYQLIHLYRKLFCEGIRLSHLYDYYMALRSLPSSEHEEVMHVIERLGMKKFAGAVMYVLQTVFAMPDEYLICKPNNRNGSFVLSITMQAGEYTRAIERTRMLKHLGRVGHHLYWLKRNRPFLTQYPAEVCFELYRRIKG